MFYKNTICRNRPPVRYPESKEILHQLSAQHPAPIEENARDCKTFGEYRRNRPNSFKIIDLLLAKTGSKFVST
jgi:hypothetical protein